MKDSSWTLDQLCAQVSLALAVDYDGAPNERIRDVPDRRTVRYYTTLGLLDRPQIEGRTALYGRRHLLQLVSIKRLQGHGLSLSEIQERLLGVSNRELQKIARVPTLAEPVEEPRSPRQSRPQFWKQTPEPARSAAARPPGPEGPVLSALRLGDEIMLLVPLARVPDEADREAVQAAAAPLLKLLRTRRLIARRTQGGD